VPWCSWLFISAAAASYHSAASEHFIASFRD
jgi:hypothetical protein